MFPATSAVVLSVAPEIIGALLVTPALTPIVPSVAVATGRGHRSDLNSSKRAGGRSSVVVGVACASDVVSLPG